MKRFGTVLIFKPGISKEKIEAAIASISEVLEPNHRLEEYDDKYGSPVWYEP